MQALRIIILVALYLLAGATRAPEDWIGKTAPDFSLETISGGGKISLKDFRGKVVLLDFWASWCAPCKRSLPELEKLEGRYPGLKVLTVNIDDDRKKAQEFMRRIQLDLTVLYDAGKTVAGTYELEAMPSALIIDQKGVIRYVAAGYTEKDLESLEAEIKALLP